MLATHGARTVLKMVLHHNFVHGDLHPGNVLVEESTGRLAILDAGICVEIPTETHKTMVRVLRAMLEYRGDDAARLLLENNGGSDDSQDQLQREEAFVDGFAKFVEVLGPNPSSTAWRRMWATSARWLSIIGSHWTRRSWPWRWPSKSWKAWSWIYNRTFPSSRSRCPCF